MYHIQSRVTMIDRRYDIQDRITSKQLPLASFPTITNVSVHPDPLVSACHRLLACPKHTHYMYHIQSHVIMIDRRYDNQDHKTSQTEPLCSFRIITIAAVNPLVSACLRYLVCPIHTVTLYVPYSVTLNHTTT
jgi:hypothetical protein